jgi:MtfA peptidase
LRNDIIADRPTVLDDYGATNPAEFFAVATECFFENPHQLQQYHPQLYNELKEFYQQDPASSYGIN